MEYAEPQRTADRATIQTAAAGDATATTHTDDGDSPTDRAISPSSETRFAWALGAVAASITVLVSRGRMATGPDAITYVSAASSLSDGQGLGNWLEDPLVTFPPGWPAAIGTLSRLGIDPELASMLLMVGAVVIIPRLVLSLLRRCTTAPIARIVGLVAVTLSPLLLPWSFLAMSEVPFTAIVLGAAVLALAARPGAWNRAFWGSAVLAATAPLMRYAGIAVPVAIAVWILLDTDRKRRVPLSATMLGLGLTPLTAVAIHNHSMVGSAFGNRLPSALDPLQVLQQGVAAIGRTAVWTLDQMPQLPALALGVATIAISIWATIRAGRSEPTEGRSARTLVGFLAVAQWGVLMIARSRAEFDDLDGRLLAPTTVLVVVLVASLFGDQLTTTDRPLGDLSLTEGRGRRFRFVLVGIALVWCLVGVGALMRGAIRSAGGPGYASEEWEAARDLAGLEQIPSDCRSVSATEVFEARPGASLCGVLANEPWAWYPSKIRPLFTPRRNAPEDMSRLEELVNSGSEVYIVWTTVNEPLGYLVPFDDLKERFRVESLDATDNSELLLITGARTGDG